MRKKIKQIANRSVSFGNTRGTTFVNKVRVSEIGNTW